MAISDNTKNVLSEMLKSGVDPAIVSALERDLDSKPDADRVVNNGILAQASFNSYRAKKDEEVQQLRENLTRMASLQNAANNLDGDVQAEAQRQVLAMEEVFKAQGYDISEVREEVNKLLTDPSALNTLNTSKEPVINKEKEMPNTNAPSDKNYVDSKTFADIMQTGLTNVAVGGIHVQTEILKAMREADKLGIDLTDEQLNSLGSVVITGAEKGKKPYEAISEHLKFNDVKQQKAQDALNAQLKEAEERGRREALKERGVVISGRDRSTDPHPIFDRKNKIDGKIDSRVDKVEDLPKNSMGQPEFFRLRRHDPEARRTEHTMNAVERYNKLRSKLDESGVPIDYVEA